MNIFRLIALFLSILALAINIINMILLDKSYKDLKDCRAKRQLLKDMKEETNHSYSIYEDTETLNKLIDSFEAVKSEFKEEDDNGQRD